MNVALVERVTPSWPARPPKWRYRSGSHERAVALTNPGLWMAHCHIAEHHESGMVFSFKVDA